MMLPRFEHGKGTIRAALLYSARRRGGRHRKGMITVTGSEPADPDRPYSHFNLELEA